MRDGLASVVVFLVALPLCMGIAIASGAPPAAGLVTGIIGGLIAGSLSGCPLQVSGPAAGLAVIVFELIREYGIAGLGPIVFAAGLCQLAAGALRVGQLFRAIAPAVVYGMLAGIGVLIFAAQFHVMVDDAPRENGWRNLIAIPQAVWKGLVPLDGTSHHLAALVGITTIGVLLLWIKFSPSKLKWVPAALVGVVTATAMAQVADFPIKYVNLPGNLFSAIRLPAVDAWQGLMSWNALGAVVALAFIASAETLLSATAVDQMHDGPRTNYDRELVSQGVGNALCGLVGGLPMTGVIVRSATNVAAGARTRLSAILHGIWLLLLVAVAPGVLRLVPTAALAAVLVYTGFKLVNPQNVRKLLKYGGAPVLIYTATVVMIVATDLLTGILVGLGLSFAKLVYALSHMSIKVRQDTGNGLVEVRLFGAATFVRLPQLVDALDRLPRDREVQVHIDGLDYIDHACMEAIANWERKRNQSAVGTRVEWDELTAKYKKRNQISRRRPAAIPTPADQMVDAL